ncbi:ADAMTS-like protein 4 [Ylistrum balloti]|uniref:ADAMTS-like protein 4 n=1 Tax=Ylistrum balloti TaxID=509963 RepID=UPI002905BDDF|nr:ADAMTS-like protein 4 [Ylistrum balloti]
MEVYPLRLVKTAIVINLILFFVTARGQEVKSSLSWNEWSSWSKCSKTCNQGIQNRNRKCLNEQGETSLNPSYCTGRGVEYRRCELQKCEGKQVEDRTAQCRRYSNHLVRGRRYQWDKYINPQNKCELSCRAIYYNFHHKFADRVEDGTSCGTDDSSDEVCVQGHCLKVGCDGVLGSGLERDGCGVCNGDNTSCQIISAIFTRTHLPNGYNLIVQIPAGACNISITEMGRSRNYLALKETNGRNIINGGMRLSTPGEYRSSGTTFTYSAYQSRGCPGQCISAPGPTDQSVDVQLLYYRWNPGIKYQFTIPSHLMDKYLAAINNKGTNRRKQHSGHHRNQSNHGNQRNIRVLENPVYRANHDTSGNQNLALETSNGRAKGTNPRSDNNPVQTRDRSYQFNQYGPDYHRTPVTSGQFDPFDPAYRQQLSQTVGQQSGNYQPRNGWAYVGDTISNEVVPKLSAQNIPDSVNYYWRIAGFTNCTEPCGKGKQQTKVVCMKRNTNVIVTIDNCDPNLRPATQTIACNTNICPPAWNTQNWTDCSVTCGEGMQTREVVCRQRVSDTQIIRVAASRCGDVERPQSARSCKAPACASWKAEDWGKCSTNCGRGERVRKVYCESIEGGEAMENICNGIRPENVSTCDMGTCAKGWFHTRWSKECSTDCGKGYLYRKVYCSAEDGTPLDEIKCAGTRPRERKRCKNKKPCGGSWFDGPWSECSATCGEGVRRRDVVCMKKVGERLFAPVKPVNCDISDKPVTEESCGPLPECPSEWFVTQWSQCSKSCDTGTRTREIKCLDPKLQPNSACPVTSRPSRRSACNKQSCELPQLDEDPTCTDTIKICNLVAQARLCTYPFYSEKCCNTCTRYRHKGRQHHTTRGS